MVSRQSAYACGETVFGDCNVGDGVLLGVSVISGNSALAPSNKVERTKSLVEVANQVLRLRLLGHPETCRTPPLRGEIFRLRSTGCSFRVSPSLAAACLRHSRIQLVPAAAAFVSLALRGLLVASYSWTVVNC